MNKLLFALLMILVPYIAHAERVYETGILQDEAGFVGDDGSKVSNAINMMGVKDKTTGKINWQWRHVLIDLPVETSNVAKVEAFLANGEPLKFGEDPNYWPGDKFVKLWLVSEEGLEFFVKITFNEPS
ncbi:hypothetical protein [uncultured Gilvimarinus sp.]|jgi:hypothetical protein|uniref:hypothetical protein n=1 Tax=uncultured Gilvimarinus sp. TaxID=1689143 RepID=UPI0030D88B39